MDLYGIPNKRGNKAKIIWFGTGASRVPDISLQPKSSSIQMPGFIFPHFQAVRLCACLTLTQMYLWAILLTYGAS